LRGLFLTRIQIFSIFPHVLLTSVPGRFQYLQPFVFRHHPILPVLITNTHGAEDWRGDSKPRGAQLDILDFGGIHAALQRGGDGRRRHFLAGESFRIQGKHARRIDIVYSIRMQQSLIYRQRNPPTDRDRLNIWTYENKRLLQLDTRSLAEKDISRVLPYRARHGKCPTDDCAAQLTARPRLSVILVGNVRVSMRA
jgi:hypothetical protein